MIKDTINNLWKLIDRPGIEDLLQFLNESDFFQAPCSTKYHLAKPGGLAEHTLNVYNLLFGKVCQFKIDVLPESVIICGLGHDLCKINFYQEGGEPCSKAQYDYLSNLWNQKECLVKDKTGLSRMIEELPFGTQFKRSLPAASATIIIDWLKNRPTEDFPELPVVYSIKDQLPLGHGEKSLSILQDYIKLTEVEKLAIRWHMGVWDVSDYSGKYAFNNAMAMTPLVTLLATADQEANSILEKEEVDH